MLTRIQVRNLKRFDDIAFDLGKTVVLIGANNSGKTTALQALALWETGLRRWNEKRQGTRSPEKRPGVAINRRDLISIPVPEASLLWRDLHVRNVEQIRDEEAKKRKQKTENVCIDVIVDGVTGGQAWSCGLEFDYANEESFYCRPLRLDSTKPIQRMPVPPQASTARIAFLPPMSGLTAVEPKWEPGRVNVLIGEGQTAQVLRNLCHQIHQDHVQDTADSTWTQLVGHIEKLFGVVLRPPQHIVERGEITMAYEERKGTQLDLSSSGRGLQQTLLLLTHLYANPKTVLLLDEPDAHLEILRQRQIYELLTSVASRQGSQIVAASHSEVILNEAADRDVVIAFVGKPHRIDDRGFQASKALKEIGFEHYYQAEQTGWVLYLEGSTDLAILRGFAEILDHAAANHLERPFVHYVGNEPNEVRKHFWALREARKDLVGVALFDRLGKELPDNLGAAGLQWKKREIENYLCFPEVLLAYARHGSEDDLFGLQEADRRVQAIGEAIDEVGSALKTLRKLDPWSPDVKATDDFLNPLFESYFDKLRLENLLRKTDYHVLARLVPRDKVDAEVVEKLDAIVRVAEAAHPSED